MRDKMTELHVSDYTPVDAKSNEGKELLRMLEDKANADQKKIWMCLMTKRQMTQMQTLGKLGWRQVIGETIGTISHATREGMVIEILRIYYKKGGKTRQGFAGMVEKSDYDKLTEEETKSLYAGLEKFGTLTKEGTLV